MADTNVLRRNSTFLNHGDYRLLKAASLIAGGSALAYWATKPAGGEAYGGTWFGYVSGAAAAAIAFLLAWYGIRKRRAPRMPDRRRAERRRLADAYAPGRRKGERRKQNAADSWRYGGSLQGWLSAHLYLGILLVVLSSLHAGFRFSFNLHTFSFALIVLVAASGLYGVFAYLHYPRLIAENIGDDSMDALQARIAELDELARMHALGLPEDVQTWVRTAQHGTRLGGNFLQRLDREQRACPTALAVQRVKALGKTLVDGDQPGLLRELYSVLLQKHRLVGRARTHISLNARLQLWLHLHAPLSIALLAALLAHVVAVFFYW